MTMRTRARATRSLLAWTAPLLLLGAPGATGQIADDLVLFSTSVTPNVLIFVDNSLSMRQIVWHPDFDPTVPHPTCTDFDDATMYAYSNNTKNVVACGNTRDIFIDNQISEDTLYWGRYLNWYFSDDADTPYAADIDNNGNGTPVSCSSGGAYALYQRTRMTAAQRSLKDVTCLVNLAASVKFGLATFRMDDPDPNGGFVTAPVELYNSTQAADFINAVNALDTEARTPLAEALFQLYTYFMSRDIADVPYGKLGAAGGVKFPVYSYEDGKNSDGDNVPDPPDSPVEFSCQKNFIIMITDGGPTRDDFDIESPVDTALGFADFHDLIGDYNLDGEVEDQDDLFCTDCESTLYLDDIALYMQTNDFNPALDGDQTIDTYMIGFGLVSGTPEYNLLQKAAAVGNGLFLSPRDPIALSQAIVAAFADIIEKSQTFTAATVPATRTAAGGSFFTSIFVPTAKSGYWEGHLRRYQISGDGSILDENGACAVDDPTPGECKSGPFLPGAPYFWDAADEIPAPSARNLLVSLNGGVVDFDQNLSAVDLGVTYPPATPYTGSTALNAEGLIDEIVQNVRGCTFGTGVDQLPHSLNVSTPVPCTTRNKLLSDIFHSNPIVIGRPSSITFEPSHGDFKTLYGQRDKVIYAGANGGFFHGFHAGEWDAMAVPPNHDAGTGEELFGFMPWTARQNIRHLPVDKGGRDYYFVDGSPAAADVWIHSSPTDITKDVTEWRTALVGAMRQGGPQYFALDVTDPDDPSYPGVAWEFPAEGAPAALKAYMGESWGEAIITRIRVNVGFQTNGGKGYERWVAIVSGGYAEVSDPNHSSYDPNATAGRGIFVIDLKTGQLLAAKTDGPGLGQVANMDYAMPASPAVYDLDFDGFADVIYQADLGGNIWKWVISDPADDVVNAGGDPTQLLNWPFRKFFQAPTYSSGGTTFYKSFFFPPSGTFYKGKLWLLFGSGERANLQFQGVAGNADNNRIYALTDLDPYERRIPVYGTLFESDLNDLTSNTQCQTLASRGYYLVAEDTEKFVTNTEIFGHFAIAASYIPTVSADPCEIGGRSKLYVFKIHCGEGFFTDNGGNPVTNVDLGTGMPTDPRLTVSPEEGGNRLIINEQTGGVINLEAPPIDDSALGQLYWRELTQ